MGREILNTALRTVFAYFTVLIAARIMGHKIISQMTFFHFVVGVTMGSVTANLALGPKPSAYSAAVIIAVLALLAVLTGKIHIKSFKVSKIVNSEPVVVIDNGQMVNRNLERIHMTISELSAQLREKSIFNMADVEFAILETDGKLSVLPKSQKMPLTPSDIYMKTIYKGLTRDLILDGNIMAENLSGANRDESWLRNELSKQGINDVKNVFYAGLDSSGGLYVSVRKESGEKHGQYGIE